MIIVTAKHFEKSVKRLPKQILRALALKLRIFKTDSFNPILNNHALRGDMRNYRSINITGDYRLIYEQYDKETVRLIDVDTHSVLYGR